ncbi:sigma-54 dependent transcriptional regulator [candidate division KSB1 bacterium]|nr:sigma-54 dependent transcriptional regulator [candidate division KSB1 bacterium]
MPFKILFLGRDENRGLLEAVKANRSDQEIWPTGRQDEAVSLLRREAPQAVVLDFDLPELQPLDFARIVWEERPGAKIIGLSKAISINAAIIAVKQGFHDVIDLREEPAIRLERELSALAKQWEERQRGEMLHQKQKAKFDFSNLVGRSEALQQVLEVVAKIIQRQWITVLIRGETGTGKELIARTIHYNSSTQTQPFVEINCSTIPENLLEAELFGYEKGAFTDAKSRKKGLFELAENGTLFLDEIGEISPAVQVKLLKAIEEKTIRRLGGIEDIQIKTRIIAATNRDLQAAMHENLFRQDLYYRLNVLTLQLPPLRERGDDVLVLARHFLSRFAEEYGSTLTGFMPEAEALLKSYHWPGNVRELKHTLERVVLLADGNIATHKAIAEAIESDTPLLLAKSRDLTNITIEIPPEGMSLDEAQKQLIEKVLEQTGWHKRRTCQALKISRPRLDRIIKKYGIYPRKLRSK